MLRLQCIRSPNSLKILCLTYPQTDNSLRSNNLLEDIAQNLQRKGLLIHFHRRIDLPLLCKSPAYSLKQGFGPLDYYKK
ncbi:MAG: hypothetical protein K0R05_1589 [Anaerocolumna sp.]|jgi:hypothetical protein|nr:hypothetical protein [Anaerocolumna sp.]